MLLPTRNQNIDCNPRRKRRWSSACNRIITSTNNHHESETMISKMSSKVLSVHLIFDDLERMKCRNESSGGSLFFVESVHLPAIAPVTLVRRLQQPLPPIAPVLQTLLPLHHLPLPLLLMAFLASCCTPCYTAPTIPVLLWHSCPPAPAAHMILWWCHVAPASQCLCSQCPLLLLFLGLMVILVPLPPLQLLLQSSALLLLRLLCPLHTI